VSQTGSPGTSALYRCLNRNVYNLTASPNIRGPKPERWAQKTIKANLITFIGKAGTSTCRDGAQPVPNSNCEGQWSPRGLETSGRFLCHLPRETTHYWLPAQRRLVPTHMHPESLVRSSAAPGSICFSRNPNATSSHFTQPYYREVPRPRVHFSNL